MHPLGSHLSGNCYQRCSITVRVRYTGYQIGCARAKCCQAHTCLSSQSSIYICHKRSPLLMACGNKPDRGLIDCIHHCQVLFAWDSEYVFHTFLLQAFHK